MLLITSREGKQHFSPGSAEDQSLNPPYSHFAALWTPLILADFLGVPEMGLSAQSFLLHYVAVTCFVAVYGFMDETVEKAVKSEGYCSRILRAQGSTRKEGYNEFSLRVEGDPEHYKPGNTYRGK